MSDKNAAIVIAVSEYQRATKLPACRNDGILVRDILRETGRFKPDHIFYADTGTDSGTIKTALPKFIEELRKQHASFDEVFFYFSGHGMFDGNDFYHVLTDYDSTKLNQTSLSNTELDGMLRSLSPALAVKVIDACESGTSYIKSPEEIQKTLKKSEQQFKNCYFMFSSDQTQSSWQDGQLSYFTRAMVRSLLEFENKAIRYQDIISFVSDQFLGNNAQKPYFVTQARHTEVFTEVLPPLVTLLKDRPSLLSGANSPAGTTTGTATGSLGLSITGSAGVSVEATVVRGALGLVERLRQRIEEEEKTFCGEEEANTMFEEIKEHVEAGTYPELLRSFFDIETAFYKDSFNSLPSLVQIARWLEQNRGGGYFVELEYEQVRDDAFPFGAMSIFGRGTRSVLTGFDTSVHQPPFRCAEIKAKPRHLNLPMWCCYLALVTSKTEMRAFYAFVKYVDKNWKERRAVDTVKWRTTGFSLKEKTKAASFVTDTLTEFAKSIETELLERYKLS